MLKYPYLVERNYMSKIMPSVFCLDAVHCKNTSTKPIIAILNNCASNDPCSISSKFVKCAKSFGAKLCVLTFEI